MSLAALVICPQISWADGFTGKEFSAWERVSQDSYIQTSVAMIGVVASRVQPEISQCINDWYFKTDVSISERNGEIRALVIQYVDYHPSAVILATVQEACGEFHSD